MHCIFNKKIPIYSLWAGYALVSGLVFYLSWLPQPQLADQIRMPGLFAAWVDAAANENLRTAVPFVLLGILAGGGLWLKQYQFQKWAFQWMLMVVIAGVAEGGQLMIPARTCDLGDIGWAAAGAALGLAIVGAAGHLRRRPRMPEKTLERPTP